MKSLSFTLASMAIALIFILVLIAIRTYVHPDLLGLYVGVLWGAYMGRVAVRYLARML